MSPLPIYERAAIPPSMQLTDRDKQLLETIASHEGVLAQYQIRELFFKGKVQRTIRERLSLLFHNGYLSRPDQKWQKALPYVIYWLGPRGAEYVSSLWGMPISNKPPARFMVEHDVAVNGFRIGVTQACERLTGGRVEEWIPSREFWAHPLPAPGFKQRVRPDGYCALVGPGQQGLIRRRCLLELDRGTEDNPRFGREKVLPTIALLKSDIYRSRFGQSGRVLVVTTSQRRVNNMLRQAAAVSEDAQVYFFTTFEQMRSQNVLTAPIWRQPKADPPFALFGPESLP